MANPLYDRARVTVAGAAVRFGGEATVHRSGEAVYDPLLDVETTAETSFTTSCIVLPIGRNDMGFDDASLTAEASAKVILPAVATPRSGDRITLPNDPARYVIIDVKPLRPDGAPIMFTCIVRRGG